METGAAPVPSLTISARTAGSTTIAELRGELDITCSPGLRDQLLGVLRRSSSRLVIDLSGVTYCDASGLAVLVGTERRARLLGGSLHLAAVPPHVDEVLRITGLDRHLDIFPTVQAATAGSQRDLDGTISARPDHDLDAEVLPGPAGASAAARTPPTLRRSARWQLPCSRTLMRGVTPILAAGSRTRSGLWLALCAAATTSRWKPRREHLCPPSRVIRLPTRRLSPRAQPACAACWIPGPPRSPEALDRYSRRRPADRQRSI